VIEFRLLVVLDEAMVGSGGWYVEQQRREGDYRMREVKPDGPRIYGDKLHGVRMGIVVGSESWQEWLQEEDAKEFVFRAADGDGDGDGRWHRARREWRGNSAYWYVSCRVGGKLRRFYLGGAKALDKARLEAVAEAIATARAKVVVKEG
jgi:hypothetical protein